MFLVPRTLLYRGSAVLINNIGALSRCKPRIPASRLFLFLPILYFDLLYLVFFSFYLIIIIIIIFFFEMQLLVPILSEVFRTVINSIRHFRTEMGTRVEMYPVIQSQFLDGLRNRLQGTCRSAIGQFFSISSVTVPEAFAKPVHTALFPSHFLKGPTF